MACCSITWAGSINSFKPIEVHSGKRIRPLTCMLVAAGRRRRVGSSSVPAAAAVEILHNFSLIHDDIEDASPTRRGRLTVWKIWGEAQAINSGDAMFAVAHLAMNRLSALQCAAVNRRPSFTPL